jgi:glycine/D-amino acid oxidase-like deaminating enzyme
MPAPAATRVSTALAAGRIAHRVLDERDLAESYPHLRFGDGNTGVLVRSAGFVKAEQCVAALLHWLVAHGVDIRSGTHVTAVAPEACEVSLSDGTRLGSDLIFVATGAWSTRLMAHWRAQVHVYRQVVVYLHPPERWSAAWRSTPAISDFGSAEGLWAAPPWAGTDLKLAATSHRRPGNPCLPSDALASPLEIQQILTRFRSYVADLGDYRAAGRRVCFYAADRAGTFRIEDVSGGAGRVWALGACSGQGFKWAPTVALAIAAFADRRMSATQLRRWAMGALDSAAA